MANDKLTVKELSLKIGSTQILKDVSFSIPAGSVCAFIGANGAGKTTTIKSIVGLYPFRKGEILINGISCKKPSSRYKLGYVPEKENFPKVPINFFLKQNTQYYNIDQKTIGETAAKFFEIFDIKDLNQRKLTKLSSGQKKKILIIQSLLHNPDLLIMDEPTENMDPDARIAFYKIIDYLKKNDKTIFISTHQLDEIQKYADYVVVIAKGQILYTGPITKKSDLYKLYEKYVRKDNNDTDQKLQQISEKGKTDIDQIYETKTSEPKKKRLDKLLENGMITKKEYETLKNKENENEN